jgi:hypothetical protein
MPLPVTLAAALLIFGSACAAAFALSYPVLEWAGNQRSDFAATIAVFWCVAVFAACMVCGFRVLFRYARWETERERGQHQRATSEGRNQNS